MDPTKKCPEGSPGTEGYDFSQTHIPEEVYPRSLAPSSAPANFAVTASAVNLSDLPKKVTKPLTEHIGRYVDAFAMNKGYPPAEVHLNAKVYDALEKALKEKGRALEGRAYKGVLLRRAQS